MKTLAMLSTILIQPFKAFLGFDFDHPDKRTSQQLDEVVEFIFENPDRLNEITPFCKEFKRYEKCYLVTELKKKMLEDGFQTDELREQLTEIGHQVGCADRDTKKIISYAPGPNVCTYDGSSGLTGHVWH